MSDQPRFEYSNTAVKKAGVVIAQKLLWTPDNEPTIRHAYSVANSWRDSHAFPLMSIRIAVGYYMRRSGAQGIGAARLKRMQAIQRKLVRKPQLTLFALQDLGGCRFIMAGIDDVNRLASSLRDRMRHELRYQNDYIGDPKDDGYRSHHMIWKFAGRKGGTPYNGRSIELQIRTELQHSWATTIEAVGLFHGEELKSHVGSEEWLRLFALMSAEFAEAEGCALPSGTPEAGKRRQEIRNLSGALDAVKVLETVTHGFARTDLPLLNYRPTHYLLSYDRDAKRVTVTPYDVAKRATLSYDEAEANNNRTDSNNQNIVLVEVEKIDNLRRAYPNYFGDVNVFTERLKAVVYGTSAISFLRTQPQRPRPDLTPIGDPSWLRGSRFPGPNLDPKAEQNRKTTK